MTHKVLETKKLSKPHRTHTKRKVITSVIRTFALSASALRGSSKKSDVVSPVNATSGDNIMSVI